MGVCETNAQLWKYLQYRVWTPCSPLSWPARFDGMRWWWVWSTTLNRRPEPGDGAHLKKKKEVLMYTDGLRSGVGKWQTRSMNLPSCHIQALRLSLTRFSVYLFWDQFKIFGMCKQGSRERSRMWVYIVWSLYLATIGLIKSRKMFFFFCFVFSFFTSDGVRLYTCCMRVCFRTYISFISGCLVGHELCTRGLHSLFCGIWDVYLRRAPRQCVCRCKQGILY